MAIPAKFEVIQLSKAPTGNEIPFIQTEYVEHDILNAVSFSDEIIFITSFSKLSLYKFSSSKIKKYNTTFFKENYLVLLFFSGSSSVKYRLKSLLLNNNQLNIIYNALLPSSFAVSADICFTYLFVEVKKKDMNLFKTIGYYLESGTY